MLTRHKPPAPSPSAPAPAPPPPSLPPSQPPSNPHVEQLKEMGFPESQVTAALRAAQNDADLAVEFLFSGNIPSSPAPLSALESAVGVERDAERAAEEEAGAGTNATVVAQLLSHPEMERVSGRGARRRREGRRKLARKHTSLSPCNKCSIPNLGLLDSPRCQGKPERDGEHGCCPGRHPPGPRPYH